MSENTITQANSLKEQGIQSFSQHDYEEANRYFQQAKEQYESADDMTNAAEMKVNIGLVHRSLGENQRALGYMQEALAYFEKQDDQMRLAQVLGNLGGVYESINDKEKAESSYRQAANIFNDLGETQLYSDTMIALGAFQVRSGQLFAGAATYQVALEDRENLSGTQKAMNWLSGIVNRISGG